MASNFHAGDHTDQFPVPSYGNRIETIVKVAEGGGPEYCGSDSNNSKPGAITKWTVTL